MKWNQYRSMMRLRGQYEKGNLNVDLTKNILPATQKQWFQVVNCQIPALITEFCSAIENLLDEAVETICSRSNRTTLRRSIDIKLFRKDLQIANLEIIKGAQRQGSRGWDSLVKDILRPQYDGVSAEKGPGMYNRMKVSQPRIYPRPCLRAIRVNKHSDRDTLP
ncbi:hypothetical protein K438DRAFT_613233 [Mycena galopus ATCC 62051]|nr:hypothetical protein K438DRAFT_613233 [Mycena galopus ATCC 62051]